MFKHFEILCTSEDRIERERDRQIGVVSTVVGALYRPVLVYSIPFSILYIATSPMVMSCG